MNILFFTPITKQSAIARMALLVANQLAAQAHQITIVRTEQADLFSFDNYDFKFPIITWHELDKFSKIMDNADIAIYQIGDCYNFHSGALHWLPLIPGIVCLHDFYLGHLFWQWAQSNYDQAKHILKTWYGQETANHFFEYSDSRSFIDGTHHKSPMTEWICSMALGVVTHSSWGSERVLNSCIGPVYVVPLPYTPQHTPTIPEHSKQEIKLLTIGHINPNKQVEKIIQSIAKSQLLKDNLTYQLLGLIEDETKNLLSSMAQELGVKLVILGQVNDQTLSNVLSESDIVACLRWPVLEAASASAIEAMLYGKPVIVTDAGFYAEIPENCSFKVTPAALSNSSSDIIDILEKLVENPDLRKKIGQNAQKWSSKTFCASNYAQHLEEMSRIISKSKPTLAAIDYFSQILDKWDGSNIFMSENILKNLSIFE
jgi:glycosyltransferase involved in cell wall biosynthesis